MLKHPAKPEPDMADVAHPNLGHRPQSALPCTSPVPAEYLRSAFPHLPLLYLGRRERGKDTASLVMEVGTGTGCSQVQIMKVVIINPFLSA